jgi:glucose/arabinose dehydrogenase
MGNPGPGTIIELAAVAATSILGGFTMAGDPPLDAEVFVEGIDSPIFVTAPPADVERVFILERAGRIRIVTHDGDLLAEPFLDISDEVDAAFEGGLLGMAFHPDYDENGLFYLNFTTSPGGDFQTKIVRYAISGNPDIADPESALLVVGYDQPAQNHNGGWIGFGPNDGYLYIASGDGGGGGGGARSQDLTDQRLGKILRLDVDGDDFPGDPDRNYAIPPGNPFVDDPDGDDEIWAYGVRNPYRCGFDRETGDLFIGDVGSSLFEEVNYQPAESAGGENYGWDCMEGFDCRGGGSCECPSPLLTPPIHAYGRDVGATVIGGVAYRGCAIPGLEGTYFFGDWVSERIWSFRVENGEVVGFADRTAELQPDGGPGIHSIVAISEDAYGEIYICSLLGDRAFRIIPEGGIVDENGNGVADSCEGPALGDLNADGVVNVVDLLLLLGAWGDCDPPPAACPADLTGDGTVNVLDLLLLLASWG